jgi:Tol biopolymer transport system component
VQRLTTSDAHDIRPAWSRDGQWIYFCSFRTGQGRVWKLAAAGGEPIQVTDGGGFEFYESADGWLYYHGSINGNGDIWRLPAGGGPAEHVLAGIESTKWTAFDAGICYVKSADGPIGLWFYDFSTRQSSRFGELPEGAIVYGSPGMSVSPDGKQIVLSLLDSQPESDVMMLDGFR